MSKYSDALKERSEVVVEGAPVVRVPHTEARAGCPVKVDELRGFATYVLQSEHWKPKILALADWIASQPAPAAPVTREQVLAELRKTCRFGRQGQCQRCDSTADEIMKLLEGR